MYFNNVRCEAIPTVVYESLVESVDGGYHKVTTYDDTVTIHNVVEHDGSTVTFFEVRFYAPSVWSANQSRVKMFINIYDPDELTSVTSGSGTLRHINPSKNPVDVPNVFIDNQLQAKFTELVKINNELTTFQSVDYFRSGDLDWKNSITGLPAVVTAVNGVKFGTFDGQMFSSRFTAPLVVVDGDLSKLSGRKLCLLAREARKQIYPELRSIKTIADVVDHVKAFGSENFAPQYVDTESVVLGDPTVTTLAAASLQTRVHVVLNDGEPLALQAAGAHVKTLTVDDDKLAKSLVSFSTSVFKDVRRRINAVNALTST